MEGDVFGVRIIPSVLQFFNTKPKTRFELPITVKNVSKSSKNIRYYGPKSELDLEDEFAPTCATSSFSLKVKNPEEPVASGLAVSAVVYYESNLEGEEKDRIVLTVDGNVIEVPIFAHPCQPIMDFDDEVDFGTVVANSKVVAKEITLTNSGSKNGDFKVKYPGDKPIAIIPNSGTIPPYSEQKIKVEYVTRISGKFAEEAEVYLEGKEMTKLKIRGFVTERALELLSYTGDNSKVQCIRFGNTYYGTDRTECAMLYNNGPEPVNFVAVVDEDAIAQELGIDLTQTTTAALAEEGEDKSRRGHTNEITSLITAIPNQGILKPYQKVPIFFRFSPRWHASRQGWKSQVCPPPRKDFALFMRLQIIGSSNGFISDHENALKGNKSNVEGVYAEVALTGTALPILLNISPAAKFDFGECPVGEHADILCTIKNESNILPALFEFRRIAHFTAHPPNGKILPGQTQDVIFSFAPKQAGSFKPEQLLDVLGQVADKRNPTVSHAQVIYTLPVKLMGKSNPITVVPKPKFNKGLTPYISNEVGMFVETMYEDVKDDDLRNAVAGATKTKLHKLKHRGVRSADYERDIERKVAFPNDRAQSIRPFDRKEGYQTLFTGTHRHNYIDPDYAYDDIDIEKRVKHRSGYVQNLHRMRERRLSKKQKKEFLVSNNSMDIGIKTAAGIFPKKLTQDEITPDPATPLPPNAEWKLLSTKELAEAEKVAVSKVCDGLSAVPTTLEEKRDCKRWLTPQQLHQIIVGPPTIDFGQICLRSCCQRELNVVNNLDQYIHIVAEIDCRELRQSSPLSQVLPPRSKAVIPIIFESSTRGRFQRSVMYTINGFYKHHVTVLAEVVPVAVELSTTRLVLKPAPGMPVEAGFRGVITLNNKLNYPAEFTWSPDLGEKGTAFSIRPATGVVDPGTDLDCEVVWHPSFMAPEDGSFTLLVNGGESRKLTCRAELGSTNVYFLDQRISFGAAPVNLTTVVSAILHNAGNNHAYFQVSDPNPLPGLTVSPVHGAVPVGGSTEIRVALTPDSIMKFDTRVQVAIKGGKTLELRIGGTVEGPDVSIDVASFNFGGVYCGSSATMPFRLENKAITKCRLEFDLTRYKDFSLAFPGCQSQEDYNYQLLNPGMASVTLEPEEIIEGEITFTPTQVAAYDFVMPVVVNHLGAPSPAPTPFPPTPAPSNKNSIQHIVNPRPMPVTVATPRKQVIATALRQPLQLGTNRLEFLLPSNFHDISTNITMGSTKFNEQAILVINNSNTKLTWGFDLTRAGKVLDTGVFKFLHEQGVPFISQSESQGIEGELEPGMTQTVLVNFCPERSGRYQAVIPVVINSEWDKPFQFLEIYGELKAPEIWFDPHSIVLTPVPLMTEVSAEFTLLASHYRKLNKITVVLPEIECEDETKITPLSVDFLQGPEIKPCSGTEGQVDPFALPCKVVFSSPKPVSFSQPIIFSDEEGNTFSLQVTATADNCLLTCYPFLALHRGDHQIVCEQGSSPKGRKLMSKKKEGSGSGGSGEAVFVPCTTSNPGNSRPSTSATSSNFQISSSSYESSTSLTDSSGSTTPGPREGAMNKPPTGSDFLSHKNFEAAARSAGSAMFPDEDSEEGMFHMEVLMAGQRWFSSQGWPGGPYPILIPETLRTAISKKTAAEPAKNKEESDSKTNLKPGAKQRGKASFNKLAKTIYDMINYLSGRSVPGIPINSPLPADPVERVKQIYWQHCTLLTFLRCQGACVSAIQPEYLMSPGDFVLWRQLQRSVKMELLQQGQVKEAEKIRIDDDVEEEVFEAISKRMWTDVLLQILKVLVLAKVTPKTLKSLTSFDKDLAMPTVNPDPLSSNIYSVAERILLAWMNHHYEHYRAQVWQDCPKGGVPPSRWIVNFDYDLMDGLVIASLLGAHMPFLIKSHLEGMYTHPTTAEQCLHNALKVVNAMRYAGVDYDIQAIDITDPNPIPLLLLVVHLYQRLPQYLPKATMEFTGSLHNTVTRQVKVSNTSPKNLVYHVLIAGRDARDFSVPKGSMVTIPPKSTLPLSVEFKSRFLRPAEAVLVLVGRRQGAATGNTLTFNLITEIDNIKPKKKGTDQTTVKVDSPCYELERVMLEVVNPFPEAGEFRIILIESSTSTADANNSSTLVKPKEKKVKVVRSKINNGKKRPETPPDVIPMNKILEQQETVAQKNAQIPTLQAFNTPMNSVQLDALGSAEVEVDFLPFHVGERQCSVIFLNENIGEFLYSIEAKALEPLPSYLPYVPSKSSVRISSAAAAGSGRGTFGGDESIIYWKCESGQTLKESLLIPVTNMVKERALIIAAQQQMSNKEMQRRQVTGTIMSCSVTSKTIKNLCNNPDAAVTMAKAIGPVSDVYRVEVDSEFFKVPDMLVMPSPLDARSHCVPQGTRVPKDVNLADGVAELPVQFRAKEPGHYPATITLRSIDDIRVYRIECTVNPEGNTAELEFYAPVHQSVRQEIPIMNVTNNDWPLKATVIGDGFSGPSTLLAKAFMTTKYPLVFKPLREEEINGKLILTNKEDGTEHVFHLTGKGQKPLALDQIRLTCGAKASVIHTVKVPNVTKKKLTYRVESDLPFISGQETVTVLPNQTGTYNFVVTPTKRGKFKGVVAFIAGENPHKEVDSDGEELPQDESGREYHGYRMWYSLEVDVKPPVPERTMTVTCACQKKAVLEVIVRNPTPKEITLTATIKGRDLTGPLMITLPPGEKDVYTLTYAPSQIGETRGSLIFFNEEVGEFWYDLVLKAQSPLPTTLPHMECELGRWTKQTITLNNPTDETLELVPSISNTNNFSLERDNERPIVLRPHSSVEVPLRFMPSCLGEADHLAKVIFMSQQLGEWVFVASGTGLLPRPQAPVSVYTSAGSNTTLIIPFRNPTDSAVLADIVLTDTEAPSTAQECEGLPGPESAFKLLIKHDSGLRVGPKSTLEIPISFAPKEMLNYQAFCTVVVRREDGQQWPYVPQDALGHKLSSMSTGLSEIRWLYPIHGVPESAPVKDNQAAGITCQARDQVEQRLEVTLAGVVPGSSGASSLATRAKTPKDKKPQIPEGVVVGNTMATAEEFSFELSYANDEAKDIIQNSVDMSIARHYRDPATGLVTLIFNVRFVPLKSLDHQVQLLVRAATGGLWKFPLRFTATEPPVDDTVFIEASGLGKASSVGFRLNSQQKHPAVFNAFFEAGSDPEFSVTPQTGELMPGGTAGTLFTVSFLPNVYGKLYDAKLIIQIPDMQWSYCIHGVLPEYRPPRGVSAKPIAGPHPLLTKQSSKKNYVRENLKLVATAVSSPVKGAPLIHTTKVM
ncbi:cilia- and flagella-associated protein 47 [Aplysia californica]|uniref:Cilia- and flagella-associated protein 47 n=1 Tax=Aplysia californica TaxID=6500 RepID=A0ABM1VU23_APLCA|nr:cilia- and flagella-associated protein 47 [Aplysia californica]